MSESLIDLYVESTMCRWCGPHCSGGAAHHARVEDGALYVRPSQPAERVIEYGTVRACWLSEEECAAQHGPALERLTHEQAAARHERESAFPVSARPMPSAAETEIWASHPNRIHEVPA